MRQVGVLYRPWRFVGSDRWRALHPGDWPPQWPGFGAGSPGIRGWTPHSQAQCWTHWPAPLQRSPGRFAPGGNPLTRCRWTRTGFVALAGSSGSGAARLHLSKLPPACGPGDGGFAPPTQNRPLGRPGHTVPRWTRVTPCALLIGAPPASLRSVLDARIVRRGSASGCAPGCTPLPPLREVAAAPASIRCHLEHGLSGCACGAFRAAPGAALLPPRRAGGCRCRVKAW